MHLDERSGPRDSELLDVVSIVASRSEFFDPLRPVTLARAPGRLDLMGGIADYSGSLVLELPLRAATWAAVQTRAQPTVTLISTAAEALGAQGVVTSSLGELAPAGGPLDYASARDLLTRDPRRAWSAYVGGAIVVLHHACGQIFEHGLTCLVHSNVPLGKGLSSSAAVEVSVMQALSAHVGVAIEGRDLALLAQRVENRVVGAPCGVMDQMTSACGRRGQLLALRCQPAEIEGHVPLPPGLEVWGIDSGIRHAVSGADYSRVRVAAFMGYRMATSPGDGDPALGGYLARVEPSTWESRYRDRVPETLSGRAFVAQHPQWADPATRVDVDATYAVRACTAHPIYENHRVELFRALLEGGASSKTSRALLGELMYQSHASYGACGLGSEGTDRLVELVRAAGHGRGLYGAKITGGGSGGTVAVLAQAGSRAAVEQIASQYSKETGRAAAIVGGSSDGAVAYGVRRLVP